MQISAKSLCQFTAKIVLALASSSLASGAIVVLEDRNSTVSIDPNSTNGMFDWKVDGFTVLANQWFYYRTSGQAQEQSIHTISAPQIKLSDTDFDPGNNKAVIRYSNSQLTIVVDYNLVGGGLGSLTSDIAEQISIKNNSGQTLSLSFFQYSDFNLGNSDQVVINPNLRFVGQSTLQGPAISETVNTPPAFTGEAGFASDLLNKLQDGNVDNLSGNLSAGPGDVAWAYQWNFQLAAGAEVLISKDKQVLSIPEPGGPLLSLVSGVGLLVLLRKRR